MTKVGRASSAAGGSGCVGQCSQHRVLGHGKAEFPQNAFHAMLDTPAAQAHMREAAALADTFDPRLHTVESVHHR
ncbi:hypothetical protein ACTWQF_16320 [Streptomyces sp. 8N114]|uniref:hypothetical protein n=1 Tax=Streptomyces sp. 8N114 TaxID=3457419 RepID=UPI003FCEE928